MSLALLACGGEVFTAAADNVVASGDDAGDTVEASTSPEAAAPTPEAGSSVDAGGPVIDARAPVEASLDAGVDVDANEPTADSGAIDSGAGLDAGQPPEASPPPPPTDPITYACGTQPRDVPPQNLPPNPALLQWWASVSVQQVDGGAAYDYCNIEGLGQAADGGNIDPFAYTCEGLATVWDCYHWLGTGGNLGCHPSTLNPAVLQVDCWVP